MSTVFRLASVALLLVPRLHSRLPSANAFVLPTPTVAAALPRASRPAIRAAPLKKRAVLSAKSSEDDSVAPSPSLDGSKSTLLGVAGIVAASIMGYSEAVLFRTGCGLPAGPLGLVGAAEGVSYLGVVGLVGFSVYTKIRTVSWCPARKKTHPTNQQTFEDLIETRCSVCRHSCVLTRNVRREADFRPDRAVFSVLLRDSLTWC